MIRRLVLTSAVLVSTGIIGPPLAAEAFPEVVPAQGGEGVACTFAGWVDASPAYTYEPNVITYQLTGGVDCTSSDSLTSGTVSGQGAGTLSCFGGISDAELEIAWDGPEPRSSTLVVHFYEMAYGMGGGGSVTAGELLGSGVGVGLGRYSAGGEVHCASAGVPGYEFAGGLMIGGPHA